MRLLNFLLLIALILCFTPANAQNNSETDSLKALLHSSNQDSQRTHLLADISEAFNQDEPDSCLDYGRRAKQLAQRINSRKGLTRANMAIALAWGYQSILDSAVHYHQLGLESAIEDKDSVLMRECYGNLGRSYMRTGKLADALEAHTQALKIARLHLEKPDASLALSYNDIGLVYKNQQNFEEALENYFKAVEIFEALEIELDKGLVYTNIGVAYGFLSKYDEQLDYFLMTADLYERNGANQRLVDAYLNLGAYHGDDSKYEIAESYFKKALKINDPEDKRRFCYIEAGLGGVAINRKQYAEALNRYQSAYKLGGETQNGQLQAFCLRQMSRAHEGTGQNGKALELHKAFKSFSDSLKRVQGDERLAEVQTEYETEKLGMENDLLAREKNAVEERNALQKTVIESQELALERWQYFLVAVILLFLLLIGLAIVIFRNNRLRTEQQIRELGQTALKAQMNPHFIFNAINSVQRFILKNEQDDAYAYLNKFGSLIRRIMENSGNRNIPLADEIETLQLYLDLEQLRFDKPFEYTIEAEGVSDIENIRIPPMLIQPYVENAIWHGLYHLGSMGKLSIVLKEEGELLAVQVKDNGIGREAAGKLKRASAHESAGIAKTQKRLELLNTGQKVPFHSRIADLVSEAGVATGTQVDMLIAVDA